MSNQSVQKEPISEEYDPFLILRNIKLKNVNRLIIGHLNINSVRNKFEPLKKLIQCNIDIFIITETKIDESFPTQQFEIEGYSTPYRLDRNANGGGILIFVREDIPCRELKVNLSQAPIEGIFLEVNLRKTKWLLFGGYNPHKSNINAFLGTLGPILDHLMTKLENFILLGDFNSEVKESSLNQFCNTYNLSNLVLGPTCYKNIENPSSIDLILTNKPKCFLNNVIVESGLSDFHKVTVTVMRSHFPKQAPILIRYRNFRKFNNCNFRNEILEQLTKIGNNITYEQFESSFMAVLNKNAPMKENYIRANNAPFMSKILCKAIMNRSRLRNKFLKNPNNLNKTNYTKQRIIC